MSLADRRAAPVTTEACPVAALLAQLPDDDAATLRAWCEPKEWDTPSILAALADEGHRITVTALARHKARVAHLRGVPGKTRPCSCEAM